MGYTHPGIAHWVIGWLIHLPGGDASPPRGGMEYIRAGHTLGINTPL
jgi:hypothetical protein